MKNKRSRKLELTKITIHELTDDKLRTVAGGGGSVPCSNFPCSVGKGTSYMQVCLTQ